ncbi:MAG: chorismate mutase [Actinomycetota bacterium]
MRVRGARGAIRVPEDRSEVVLEATSRLVGEILDRNAIATDDLVSMLFTTTDGLSSVFPAEAARRMGLGRVPLLCAREIPVEGAMPNVIRILVHFHSDRGLDEVEHVYLDGAESLRDDLD